jgi:HK97 family phage major capsid protein
MGDRELPLMLRLAEIDKGAIKRSTDGKDMMLPVALASEYPVARWYGTEVLSMDKGSARLARLNDGAVVLFNHDPDEIRGSHVPGSLRISKDRVLRADIAITGATQAGRDAQALIEGGHLTKTSIGYHVHRLSERNVATGESRELDGRLFERAVRAVQSEGGDIAAFRRKLDTVAGPFARGDAEISYLITDWEPFESSLVSAPADPTVGIGRAQEIPAQAGARPADNAAAATIASVAPTSATNAVIQTGATRMTETTTGAATTTADPPPSALEAEKQRKQAILNYCAAVGGIAESVQRSWIEQGASLEKVADELVKVREERGRKAPTVASDLGLSPNETKRYSVFKAVRALRYGSTEPQLMQDAAYELECSREIAKRLGGVRKPNSILVPGEVLQRPVGRDAAQRAMSVVPGSKGGYTVPVELMGFIDILRNRSVAMRMGATVLSGLTGNVAFPRQTASPSVTWQAGENVSITPADQTLGQLSMTPKTCIARTDVSEQLLAQTSNSAENFVMADLAKDVAIAGVDYAVINGTGGAQPLGIKNTTGITSGQDAASATYAKILAFVSTAGALNAILGNPGFVTTTAGAARLMQVQRFTSTDTPLWEGNMLDGQLVQFNAMSSEQLASGNIIFGSWDTCVIGEWGVLELATDNGGTRFDSYTVGVRAVWMVDVMLRYPTAWVVGTNLS